MLQAYGESAGSGNALLAQAIVRARLAEIAGTDISLQYEVLPLLEEPATLFVEPANGSGALGFLLEGQADAVTLAQTMDRLHASVAASLATGVVTRSTFEDTTVSQVRQDPDALQSTEEQIGRWHVRRTGLGENSPTRGIATASDGRHFMISNNRAWTDAWLHADAAIPLPRAQGQWVMGGVVRTSDVLPGGQGPLWDFLLPGLEQQFAWSVEQMGGVRMLIAEAL